MIKAPEGTRFGVWGFAGGAIAAMVIGFTWGGWVTGGTAEKMARNSSEAAVVSALLPICLAQSKGDPNAEAEIAKINAASSYSRGDVLEKTGWATMPGAESPARGLAAECAKKLGVKS